MFTHDDIAPLSIAAGTAAAIGLAFGLWLALPTGPAPEAAEVDSVGQIDPNLAAYRQMLIDDGVNATPYVLAAGYAPARAEPAAPPVEVSDAGPAAEETETTTSSEAPDDTRQAMLAPPQPPVLPLSADPKPEQVGSS
jgi:hypothetical protein